MSDKIRLVYLDEEEAWQSQAHSALKNDFQLLIPEYLPRNIEEIWEQVNEFKAQAVLIDYRLNNTGEVSYTGNDVIHTIRRHNKHLPTFIITSHGDKAFIDCKEAQIISGKELITNKDNNKILVDIITASVNFYNHRKESAENLIRQFQNKIAKGETLTGEESAARFEAEHYLSELDLDNSVRSDLITSTSNETLEELLKVARDIVNQHKK